jgi:hypothetical protein
LLTSRNSLSPDFIPISPYYPKLYKKFAAALME